MHKINLEVLADGTICVDFDAYHGQAHKSADEFLEELEDLLGSRPVVVKRKKRGHSHVVHGRKITHTH